VAATEFQHVKNFILSGSTPPKKIASVTMVNQATGFVKIDPKTQEQTKCPLPVG